MLYGVFIEETFCYGRRFVKEIFFRETLRVQTFCRGDILFRRHLDVRLLICGEKAFSSRYVRSRNIGMPPNCCSLFSSQLRAICRKRLSRLGFHFELHSTNAWIIFVVKKFELYAA
jgi:hypothetical protein